MRLSNTSLFFFSNIPQLKQDHLLNLSILISGGKENNSDSPSNGEWTGKSSDLKSGSRSKDFPNCSLVSITPIDSLCHEKVSWNGLAKRVRPPFSCDGVWVDFLWVVLVESGCLRVQPKMGGKLHLKLNKQRETDSEKVPWGKDEKYSGKRVKSAWNCWKGSAWT